MFERIFEHNNIKIELNSSYYAGLESNYKHVFNAMPIDEYFNFKYGQLPYRSIIFHEYTVPIPVLLPVATVNFTHSEKYTRVTEWKKIPGHGQNEGFTTLTVEEPCDYKDNCYERYYPVKDTIGENRTLYKRYLSEVPDNMTFVGRCGLYAYLDMHQAISVALTAAKNYIDNKKRSR